MSGETIESLTAQIKELRELMDRQHNEAMREIKNLKEKLGQKQSTKQDAAKVEQPKEKSKCRSHRRGHPNETSVLVLAKARSDDDKNKLI